MRAYHFIIIILLSVIITSCVQEKETHQLKVRVQLNEKLEDGQSIYISGNHMYLGEWAPDVVSLDMVDEKLWEGVFLFPEDTILEFKFTKGDWNLEAITADGEVPPNHRIDLKNDTTLIYAVENWKDQIEMTPGKVVGTIETIKNFEAKEIKDRNVSIWFPPGYETDIEKRYPVLYVHDGQNVFDKRRSGYNIEWELDETADSLIRNGIVEPFMIVAVDNDGPNRSYEYSDCELGTKYRNFLIQELKPYIDANYRSKPDVANTATLGSSMGGLVSFILAWENPDVFSKAGCYSPAFIYNEHNYVEVVKNYTGPKKEIELYIDNGGIGLEEKLQPGIDQMMQLLDEKTYDYQWQLFKKHDHNELAWAKRSWIALEQFYGLEE